MFCPKCGKEMPEGGKFCPFCGNAIEKKSRFHIDWKSSYIKISAAVVAGVILIIFVASMRKEKDERVDSTILESSVSVAETIQTVETTEEITLEKETEQTQESMQETKEYSIIAANGETLSALPGFAKVMCICDYTGTERVDVSINIPSIEAYTNGEFQTNEETYEEDHYERMYSCNQIKDGGFMDDYVNMLTEFCGFTLENTVDISDDQKVYFLNYNGEITHGADDWLGIDYDISIRYANGSYSSQITFRYPEEVGFTYDDDSQTYYSCVDTETGYEEIDDKVRFSISGWGENYDDCIYINLNKEVYQTGDTITLDDLLQQYSAGENALCNASIWGPLVSGEEVVGIVSAEDLKVANIEILEKTNDVIAIHYYLEAPNHASMYTLEGIAVARTSNEQIASDNGNEVENSSSSSGSTYKVADGQSCMLCNGSGKTTCHTCGGDGFEQCPNCNGVGYYFDTVMGINQTCKRCDGRGSISCSNSHCINGLVTCGSCNGTGEQ